jgi:hypothetical protein
LGEGEGDSNGYRYERYQQFGDNEVEGYCSRPIAFLALKTPTAHRAFLIHSEAPAEELTFATIRTA